MRSRLGILFLIGIFLYSVALAQQAATNYTSRWIKVDSLINKNGLTQSALTEVNSIYAVAKKEKNDPELIKSLIYRIHLEDALQEESIQKSTDLLEKEIQNSQGPATSILNSLLAELYWSYLQQNRWKLYQRKNTINFKKTDIATWTVNDFHQKISSHYINSLRDEKLLEQTKLEPFSALIIHGNVRYLRPTLFDLLAHRALDYFTSDESDIVRPTYAFEIENPTAFAPANEFVRSSFPTKDSISIHYRAVLLYQQLIRFHLQDPQPDAFIDVDIQRILFMLQYGVMENREDLYYHALGNITSQYPENKTAASAWYLEAQYYFQKAASYDPLRDTSNRFAYLQAKSICEKVSKQSDSSQGKSDCERLIRQILRKELLIEAEKVNVPNKPFRMLISYRNCNLLHFRIIRLDRKTKESLNTDRGDDHFWKPLTQLTSLKTFYETLPETADYQLHRVEMKIDALESGSYCLLASMDKDFSTDNNHLAVEFFEVSNIAYINITSDYFVVNRETGQPLQNIDVQVWYKYYDNKLSKQQERKGENFNTDKNGLFHINAPKTTNYSSVSLECTGLGDHLWIDEMNYNRYYNNDIEKADNNPNDYEAKHLKTFFFMDRSIYRPGQSAFFKGILITKDFKTKKSKILNGFRTTVYLTNANNQRIDSMQLTTNEFGSYHGEFRLPQNVLTGEFKLSDSSNEGEKSFSVEEYKRPKFKVRFDQPKGSYRVNDSIRITGFAKAYAGNNINNGMVRFRVIRQARFPYPWLYGRWGMPRTSEQEIAHGEMKTDAEGKFNIGFIAVPDNTINKKLDPVFNYVLSVDVTDINGETRSNSQNIVAGYKELTIGLTLAQNSMPSDSLRQIVIRTENLSREFVPTLVTLSIYALKSPDRLIRERYWQRPDQFLMPKTDYINFFPQDEYSNETDKETWMRNKIYEKKDSSRLDGIFRFDTPNNDKRSAFLPGWYLIEAGTIDQYGQEVQNHLYVQLYDSKSNLLAAPAYLWIKSPFDLVQPNQNASLTIGSSANDVSLNLSVVGRDEHFDFKKLNKEFKTINYPITDSDRGGFSVYYAFVKDNRFFSGVFQVAVPWVNKELAINYSSYRDKTLPGSEEKWKLKLSGYSQEKIASELITSMYDASLDQFKPQVWQKPEIYSSTYSYNRWIGQTNFSSLPSLYNYLNDYGEKIYFSNRYDLLLSLQNHRPSMIFNEVPGSHIVYNFTTRRSITQPLSDVVLTGYGASGKKEITSAITIGQPDSDTGRVSIGQNSAPFPENIQLRKNFKETAFFLPDLHTDDSGNVEFSFTMPEALTQWKWMTFAHTKDLAFGYSEKTIVTQKQLMVQPNAPRFIRQGDHMEFAVKIVNLTDTEMTGQAQLQLVNAATNQSVDGWFSNRQANQYFTAAARTKYRNKFSDRCSF